MYTMASRTLYCCLLAVVFAIATPSFAKTKKAKAGSQVRILKDSSESTAERSRRLLRECKGRPNAGACAGYTR
ncbi:hypothetical protein [Rhodoferax sp.]|uniref:hypothetical protein n=1 Tax=Rhodoferax sp. TaxID=50421 RepID=UPI0025EBFE67|nr:hypothetical protein [Rhodoferax sp.]